MNEPRAGRPKASSRETIAEAASELFLEQGYEQTSISDIATRAGVSRSSFFNYFGSKADVLWGGFDERMDAAIAAIAGGGPVAGSLARVAAAFAPDSLALAVANAPAMGIEDELARERAVRQARLAQAVCDRLRADGEERLDAEVRAAAYAAAVFAAVWAWADAGPGRTSLAEAVRGALSAVPASRGEVRQLRVVVRAEDFDEALTFYRDTLGLVEQESYDGDEGARVVILGAGRATLELSNPAQVRFIDGVETDGVTSPHIRLAFEVPDALAGTDRLVAGGAELLASTRETPWRSLNSRLAGPADLQLTLFQELGDDEE